jgi:tetratricopeptide (TPR) repeat protein
MFIIVFLKTSDENYFKVINKIPLNQVINFEIDVDAVVTENREINYLKKGIFRGTADPNIYSSGELSWRNIYQPLALNSRTAVVQFVISSLKLHTAINEYSESLSSIRNYIILITSMVILALVAAFYLFTQNYTLLIRNLSGHMKRARSGDLDVRLRPRDDSDLSELAESFNSLIEDIKDLKEKGAKPAETEADSMNAVFRRGVDLLKDSRFDDSISIFRAFIIMRPESFSGYFNLGVALAKKRNYSESLSMFQKARELNPAHDLTRIYVEKVVRLKNAYEPENA